MLFQPDQRLRESGGGVTRWRVRDVRPDHNLTYLKLYDNDPAVQPPMVRESVGVCINYYQKLVDQWLVQEWRRQFLEACESASGSFAGLPEPVDFFYIRSTDREVPDNLRGGEPLMVYCYARFEEVYPLQPKRVRNREHLGRLLKNFVYDLAYILRSLHSHGVVARQLPLTSLRWLPSSRQYFIGEFMSLARQGSSNFHPNIPFLSLSRHFSAPECFRDDGRLTPATDIYALAKTLLLYLGARINQNQSFPASSDEFLTLIHPNFREILPEPVIRFLSLALRENPQERPQTMGEVMGLISGKPPMQLPHQSTRKPPRKPWKPKGRF
jgi:serine/threonine protein kinase